MRGADDRQLLAAWSLLNRDRWEQITPDTASRHLAAALRRNPAPVVAAALRAAAERIKQEGGA